MAPPSKFFAYVGAKPWLTEQLLEVFQDLNPSVLVSPFAGTGVFEYELARKMPECKVQLYDTNAALVNFHQCYLQRQPELARSLQGASELSRDDFQELGRTFANLQPLERPSLYLAARYAKWQQQCFCGKWGSYVFGTKRRLPTRAMCEPPPPNLSVSHQDGLDALQAHLRQDSNTAYYLDPPYYVRERHYASGSNMSFPHLKLAEILDAFPNALWVLSYNDCPEIRQLFAGAVITQVLRRASTSLSRATELLIFSPAAAR